MRSFVPIAAASVHIPNGADASVAAVYKWDAMVVGTATVAAVHI